MEQSVINDGLLDPDTNWTLHLAEINAAPQWLWTALVQQMVESGWTVQVTRQSIAVRVPVSSSGATPTNPCRPSARSWWRCCIAEFHIVKNLAGH